MSSNFNTPSGLDWEKSTATADIIPLPLERKQPAINETKEELKLLTAERMQKITNADFLQSVKFSDRLKNITEPNINSADISEKSQIEFNFSFTSEKENRNLFLLTTAGQVLPQSVDNVTTANGKQYSRESLCWEFFAEDGKRLIIRDKTQITIGDLRTNDEIVALEKQAAESLKNIQWASDENRELLSMWASKGINPALVLKFFSVFFGTSDFSEVKPWEYEDFLTQVDREIGYMNMDEKRADKNNLSQEAQAELEDRMGKQTSMHTNYENIEVGSHQRFLDFISTAEWTQNNYNAVFADWGQSEIKITSMSLRDVLYYQTNTLLPSVWHTPVWKYQFNKDTLEDYIDRFGFSLDQKMDVDFQDKIAIIKMKESGLDNFQSWKISQQDFEKNIAWIWAGFPKDASGKSYYDWVAGNKAQVAYNDYSKEISYLKWAAA